MSDITLVDIFFTITAAAIILTTILVGVVMIYIISIFMTIRRVIRTAEFASEVIRDDLMELRQNIKEKGVTMSGLFNFFAGLSRKKILPKRRKK
jgi:hypothetical protein